MAEPEVVPAAAGLLWRAQAAPDRLPTALAMVDSATRAIAVSRLQTQHGNAYVQRLVAAAVQSRPAAVQREAVQREAPKGGSTPTKGTIRAAKRRGAGEEAIGDEDRHEFDLLKSKIQDATAAEYVKHRATFFGSTEAYQKFAAESDAELDGTKGLRRLIELHGEAQTVYYRWVRKAYQNAGVDDVPGLIKRGMSKEVKDALAKVKSAYGKSFQSGGFNPRPKKDAKYRYRLGTISEHALGNAVDIEDRTNPIVSLKDWRFVEKTAGKTVDRSATRWKSKPKELWDAIDNLNTLFVQNVAAEVERVKAEREKAKAAATDDAKAAAKPTSKASKKKAKTPEPIDVVFAKHEALKKWAGGFFTLPWPLVKQLHDNGFTWGATFSNAVDLHHFEL